MNVAMPDSALRIALEVAWKYKLRGPDLFQHSRRHRVSHPRQEAFARIREEITINHRKPSYPQIARWFGFADHTTVLLGIRSYQRRARATTAHEAFIR